MWDKMASVVNKGEGEAAYAQGIASRTTVTGLRES